MFITDTTFRDGQQARPPYTVKQIARIYDLLHKLGGKSGSSKPPNFSCIPPRIARPSKSAAPEATASPASPAGSAPTWTTSNRP